MKDYKTVVQEHFNQNVNAHTIYHKDQPVGKYSLSEIQQQLSAVLATLYREDQVSDLSLMDIGCGAGGMIELFIEQGFSPENIIGLDLSEKRIETAKQHVKGVVFELADVTKFKMQGRFDLITNFDLLSHLKTKQELDLALNNIFEHLNKGGHFLWYDIYNEDHFKAPEGVISWGFNQQQMVDLASAQGFKLVQKRSLFKRFFGKYHSVYQARRVPSSLLRILEKTLPGTPGNLLMVFQK